MRSNGPFGYDESELLKLAVNPRRAPVGIFLCQAPDQDANFLADSRSPATLSGPPPPIEAETGAMPADDGVWVHNDKRFGPAGPKLLQQDPEQSIRRTQAGSRPFAL